MKPGIRSTWTFDFSYFKRDSWPLATPGRQKLDLAGRAIDVSKLDKFFLCFRKSPSDIHVRIENLRLCSETPDYYRQDTKLLDEMGQFIPKSWPSKQPSIEAMTKKLNEMYEESCVLGKTFSSDSFNRYGGYTKKKLCEGTGYFSTFHDGKRWWLTDPEGYAFFSIGTDCVGKDRDTRVDQIPHLLKWLPEASEYPEAHREDPYSHAKFIDYPMINLMRAFPADWKQKWFELCENRLHQWGLNTIANWSDEEFIAHSDLPYVLALNCIYPFPTTDTLIYSDFPDVFSEQYRNRANHFAEGLKAYIEDSRLIGYFMCNEPGWGFEKNLNLVLEVLRSSAPLASRQALVSYLQNRYSTIQNLNDAWNCSFSSFEDLLRPQKDFVIASDAAEKDLDDFTCILIREYVAVPAKACKAVDPHHLNLGMRWAFVKDPKLLSGWEYLDVFSINCYKIDPKPSIQDIVQAGVEKPVIIGEFHHGALDAGNTATGIRGVASKKERGKAYRYYVEQAASMPNLVGCHYFTFNDQSALGRMDGECYNIGFVDACHVPYPDMVQSAQQTSQVLYEVADGKVPPFAALPKEIPAVFF